LLKGIEYYLYSIFARASNPKVPWEDYKSKYIYNTDTTSLLQLRKQSDIEDIVIPFFNQYPILGVKCLDFEDFKKVNDLVKKKDHLIKQGLFNIIEIVSNMNLKRVL
jgi:hypothetical protein